MPGLTAGKPLRPVKPPDPRAFSTQLPALARQGKEVRLPSLVQRHAEPEKERARPRGSRGFLLKEPGPSEVPRRREKLEREPGAGCESGRIRFKPIPVPERRRLCLGRKRLFQALDFRTCLLVCAPRHAQHQSGELALSRSFWALALNSGRLEKRVRAENGLADRFAGAIGVKRTLRDAILLLLQDRRQESGHLRSIHLRILGHDPKRLVRVGGKEVAFPIAPPEGSLKPPVPWVKGVAVVSQEGRPAWCYGPSNVAGGNDRRNLVAAAE